MSTKKRVRVIVERAAAKEAVDRFTKVAELPVTAPEAQGAEH